MTTIKAEPLKDFCGAALNMSVGARLNIDGDAIVLDPYLCGLVGYSSSS